MGRSRGGWTTKIHLAVDKAGRPLAIRLFPGQAGDNPELIPDNPELIPLLEDINVPVRAGVVPTDRFRPYAVVADKAYSHPSIREAMRRRGTTVCIPERSDQVDHRRRRARRRSAADVRPRRPPRPERRGAGLQHDEEWRSIGTRYDELAVTYLGGVVLSAIVRCWLRWTQQTRPSRPPRVGSRNLGWCGARRAPSPPAHDR